MPSAFMVKHYLESLTPRRQSMTYSLLYSAVGSSKGFLEVIFLKFDKLTDSLFGQIKQVVHLAA
jgi:hypothetical protein